MKTIKIATAGMILGLMILADIPILPVQLVPDAQAIFGTRRRTAVVAYSAGAHSSQQQAAAAEQEAAAAKQEAAAAQQQAAAAQASPGAALGTVVESLPQGCIDITVSNNKYEKCDNTYYRAAFMGDKLVYVSVKSPL